MLDLFDFYGELIEVTSNIKKKCRDANDDFLLSIAVDSQADYLVTGDKDLLSLVSIQNTKIITIDKLFEKV